MGPELLNPSSVEYGSADADHAGADLGDRHHGRIGPKVREAEEASQAQNEGKKKTPA
jgi:hypothetical protein